MQLGRKQPPEEPRGRSRQSPNASGSSSNRPAFSYYSSSRPVERSQPQPQSSQPKPSGKRKLRPITAVADSKTRQRVRRSLSARLPYILLMAVLLVCAIKVLSLSTTPKVVIVSSNTNNLAQSNVVYQQAATKILASSTFNRSKLTFSSDQLVKRLQTQFPELQSVSVALPLIGNHPIVYVAPVQPSLTLESGGSHYAMSHSGVVLAKIAAVSAQILPLQDESGSLPVVGKRALPASTVSFAETVAYELKAANVPISGFVLPKTSAYELDVTLTGKPYVARFNLQADARQQSGALIATLSYVQGKAQPISYIDVRVPERAYYK